MKTKYRDFLIRCHANRGGRHLIPIDLAPITLTPDDPLSDYTVDAPASPDLSPVRGYLSRRGDLITLASGAERITRRTHIGKVCRPVARARRVFVRVRVPVAVSILEDTLAESGIDCTVNLK